MVSTNSQHTTILKLMNTCVDKKILRLYLAGFGSVKKVIDLALVRISRLVEHYTIDVKSMRIRSLHIQVYVCDE